MPFYVLVALLLSFLSSARADEPATGILKVKTTAPSAEVFLDGVSLGQAPLTKYIPVGAHKLRIIADNFDPFVRTLDVQADKTLDVSASMVAGSGTIEFTGPKGTTLAFEGTNYPLPARVPAPKAGAHEWKATAPGFEEGSGKIDFATGKNYLIEVKLESSAGVVAVTSTPAGAKVQLDGVDVGVTPWKGKDVPLGKHAVAVLLDGYAASYRAIDTSAGTRGEVVVGLQKKGATLVVTTGSSDATVFVNENNVGSGGNVTAGPIERGRVRVRVVNGEHTVESTLSLPSSGSLAIRVAGNELVERKPLTSRWGFWAAIAGGAVAGVTVATVAAVESEPPPLPTGDSVVTLP